jgi:hypothetical protein
MMSNDRTSKAAYNNAVWCDLVCSAYGQIGEFSPGIWINRHQVPQFYPNAVTLSYEVDSAPQLQKIRELIASKVAGLISIKDSFATLDLTPLGFDVLFTSQWIYRPSSMPLPRSRLDGIRLSRVETPEELLRWEDAWRREDKEQSHSKQSRIFMPALLDDRDVVVVGAFRDQRIVAGLIANRTGDVVGISNVFAPAGEEYEFGVEGLATVMEAFPGRAIVGYEEGRALESAQRMGFETIGSLRVWIQRES